MADPTEDELKGQLATSGTELDRRARQHKLLDRYYEGKAPMPEAIVRANVTRAYRTLMPVAESPWGSLIVDSKASRLAATGIQSDDKAANEAVWGVWQDNQMDSVSKLAHNAALVSGRAFALVWPGPDGRPEISIDTAEQMIVRYREGSHRHRVSAMRRWIDENDIPHATLYRPEAIYKFKGPKNASGMAGTQWQRREVPDEVWPLPNPLGIVPAVELAVNRRIKPGSFGFARGEFEHSTGLLDRIHMLTFLGLVVAFWMGFPLRVLIGDKILKDDKGNELPPFKADPGSVAQFENPDAKIDQFDAADRSNLSVYSELDQLATVTTTPRHYLPMENGMANLSADAIRASEGSLVSKMPDHKDFLGEGWEEVLRLSGMMLDNPVKLSPRAALQWSDHESRSLAERADAASKLKDILPWQPIAEKVLNATADDISRWSADRASEGLNGLITNLAQQPAPAAA